MNSDPSQYHRDAKLPDAPGVYFFLGPRRKLLYIGRATSLRSRVRSYFDGRLAETRGPWVAKMLPFIKIIDYRKTDSVLEAILLESDLIKKFQPPFNTDEKDDKSFNCVVITKEDFPAVFIARTRDVDLDSLEIRASGLELRAAYGPFTNGFQLHTALKLIRHIFPYRDRKCVPCTVQMTTHKGNTDKLKNVGALCKPCFSRQIGLCPGVCTGEISRDEYAKTIRNIRLFFEGKKSRIMSLLRREMKSAAKAQEFELASEKKRMLFALQHIQDIALMKREDGSDSALRIESYDLSHFGGDDIVGAMTVVVGGQAVPSEYRLFKLRSITEAHEVRGLQEVLRRRFNHPEWPIPQLIVVDGNEVQKAAAERVLQELRLEVPVVSVRKDERHKPAAIIGPADITSKHGPAILLANSESHRFVLKFQRKRRRL